MHAPAEKSEYGYLELLGRVKVALASATEVAVPAGQVRPYADQPRRYFDAGATARLSESIDASGQTTAGIIRRAPGPAEYELIDGERRWRAIMAIPASRRPDYRARLIEADDEVVQYLISGIANFNREGHTPLETSDTIGRLAAFGLPIKEVAALLGISEFWAVQMRGLAKLAPEVRAMLAPEIPRAERLPVTAAIEISKCEPRIQPELARRVLARDVTLAGLRAEVVRVARSENSYLRTRTGHSGDRWSNLHKRVGALDRLARDANALDVAVIARSRSLAELRRLGASLRSAQGELTRLQGRIEEALKRCS